MNTEQKQTENKTQKNLELFFEEKNVPYASWELVDNEGTYHYISSEIVIEGILRFNEEMQKEIQKQIIKIDFYNAPVLPFLKHIAMWMINNIR